MNRKTFLRIAFVVAAVALLVLAVGIRKTVTLRVDGEDRQITTMALTVEQALAQAGVALGENDAVTPGLRSWLADGDQVTIERAAAICIEADGKTMTVFSSLETPAEVLRQAGITYSPEDMLLIGMEAVPLDQRVSGRLRSQPWQLRRAITFQLQEGSQTIRLSSHAATVGQALWENGILLKAADRLDPPMHSRLMPDMEVRLIRARELMVTVAGAQIRFQSAAATVGEAIQDAGLTLQGLDYTLPHESEALPPDGQIRLIRVREEIILEQTPIPFETRYAPAADLELDRQTILEAGSPGIEAQRIRVRYEDEQEISRQVEETWVAQPPQNRVIGYGTQIVMRSVETPDGVIQYWRALQVYATSYNPTSAGGSITSTGQSLRKGIIAVNPRYIPYGTVLYVPGYGYGVAADTGRLGPRQIDLGYSDEDYVSWHQTITVYFVWPPPENVVWIIP